MQKQEIVEKNMLYWAYIIGFFLIVAQVFNTFSFWVAPIEWGKSIFFRIILSIIMFLFFWQIIYRKVDFLKVKEKIKSAYLPIAALSCLFLIYLLATIFSVGVQLSLWGSPFRSGGFVNFAFYIFLSIFAFLIIRDKEWKKIIDFSIIAGLLVCAVAFIQIFGLFDKYIISFEDRPISVLGNPILLALYLLLITFLPISLGIAEKNKLKKFYYFFSSFIFLFVSVFLAKARGAYIGLFIGFLFFLFFYIKKPKIRIYAVLLILSFIFSMFLLKIYLDNHLDIYARMPFFASETLDRALGLFEGIKASESRVSVWKVSWEALKARPILGYGPENFMVAFDKYYDPSLPQIAQLSSNDVIAEWFDRAHNIIFDTSINAGIFAVIIYFSVFGIVIWKLEKAKKKNPDKSLICLALQATFIGYLITLLSEFDNVSTYISSFLLIGYSLHLISESENINLGSQRNNINIIDKLYKYKAALASFAFVILIIFLWNYNIRPLYLNKEMNIALAFAEIEKETQCKFALNTIEKISPSIPNSIISSYLGQKSTFVVYRCLDNMSLKDEEREELIKKAILSLKQNIEKNPQYVTDWILTGEYTNILIKEKNKNTENVFISTEETEAYKKEADYYFENALKLSPKRQIIFKDWSERYMITGEYEKAEENINKCISLNPEYALCYWYAALNKGYQKDYSAFESLRSIAKEKGYGVDSLESLQELVNMHIRNDNYEGLIEVYPKLIERASDPLEKAQLYASLAASYKEIGDIKKAREEVLKIKDIIPLLPENLQDAAEKDVESFLEILK